MLVQGRLCDRVTSRVGQQRTQRFGRRSGTAVGVEPTGWGALGGDDVGDQVRGEAAVLDGLDTPAEDVAGEDVDHDAAGGTRSLGPGRPASAGISHDHTMTASATSSGMLRGGWVAWPAVPHWPLPPGSGTSCVVSTSNGPRRARTPTPGTPTSPRRTGCSTPRAPAPARRERVLPGASVSDMARTPGAWDGLAGDGSPATGRPTRKPCRVRCAG